MLSLSLLVYAQASRSFAAVDPCLWNTGDIRPISNMFDCFHTVPFSTETANHTSESVLE
jgi:hypothetical protein